MLNVNDGLLNKEGEWDSPSATSLPHAHLEMKSTNDGEEVKLNDGQLFLGAGAEPLS